MTTNFMDVLSEKIKELNCRVCLGLDPRFEGKASIPTLLIEEHEHDFNKIIKEFNFRIIEQVADLIPTVKIQIAYYEAFNAFDALQQTIQKLRKLHVLVILDAKRNDIGATSEAYAKAVFNNLHADATTINAYMGSDTIIPFLKRQDKGLFILVKTSNKSSAEFQDLFSIKKNEIQPDISRIELVANEKIVLERNFMKMARLVQEWNAPYLDSQGIFGRIGAVIGATYPQQLKDLREKFPRMFFLIPGFGFQGGTPEDVKHGFTPDGQGAIINSSRGLLYAYRLSEKYATSEDKFEHATRNALLEMKENINEIIEIKK
ncbi:MAG: orotidine-5'-phosphate decarboxylase [Promethearchaeota archaeon]